MLLAVHWASIRSVDGYGKCALMRFMRRFGTLKMGGTTQQNNNIININFKEYVEKHVE